MDKTWVPMLIARESLISYQYCAHDSPITSFPLRANLSTQSNEPADVDYTENFITEVRVNVPGSVTLEWGTQNLVELSQIFQKDDGVQLRKHSFNLIPPLESSITTPLLNYMTNESRGSFNQGDCKLTNQCGRANNLEESDDSKHWCDIVDYEIRSIHGSAYSKGRAEHERSEQILKNDKISAETYYNRRSDNRTVVETPQNTERFNTCLLEAIEQLSEIKPSSCDILWHLPPTTCIEQLICTNPCCNIEPAFQHNSSILVPESTSIAKDKDPNKQNDMCKGRSFAIDYNIFSDLFFQNSAFSDMSTDKTDTIDRAFSVGPDVPTTTISEPHKVRTYSQRTTSEEKTENLLTNSENCKKRSPSTLDLDHSIDARLSLASSCGVNVKLEELNALDDVPLEFTIPELFLRRAAKDEANHDERESITLEAMLENIAALEKLQNKRSSILKNAQPDVGAVRLSLNNKITTTNSEHQAAPRVQRTSLCMIHPPEKRLFSDEPETLEDPLQNGLELGSRLTWATLDSTEISRGMKLTWMGFGSSSSELVETFQLMKELDMKEDSLKLQDSYTTPPYERNQPYSARSLTTCTITPSLHYCSLGKHDTNSKDFSGTQMNVNGFINGLKKLARERVQAKRERLPLQQKADVLFSVRVNRTSSK